MPQSQPASPPARLVAALGLVALLAATLVTGATPAAAQPFDDDPSTVQRVDAGPPVDAAVAVSRLRFPADGTATSAVLATLADFADAMTGTSLTDGAPLLLTAPSGLDPQVAAELSRVLPPGATVHLLGGEQALEPQVVADVEALGFTPDRIAGPSRFETAAEVARERLSRGPVTEVLLARGLAVDDPTAGWADAITGGAAQLRPILLTPSDVLHGEALAFLRDDASSATVTILGGPRAVSQDVEDDTPRVVARLAGATRDGTAAAIAARFFGVTPDTTDRRIVVFDGFTRSGWTYGLVAAPLAREQGAPLMPVALNATAQETARLIACGAEPADVLVVGSTDIVSDEAVAAHRECPPPANGEEEEQDGLLVLDGTGLGADAPVGGGVEETIAAVSAVLGAPTEDTGWVVGCPLDDPVAPNERTVRFGEDLSLAFYDDGSRERFTSWRYDLPATTGLATARGITPASTNADVPAAYPGASYTDDVFGPMWSVGAEEDGPMFFFPADDAPGTPLGTMFGGELLFCD